VKLHKFCVVFFILNTDLLDIRNEDCMDLMSKFSDNYFDLAVVDPPYGIEVVKSLKGESKKPNSFLNSCNGIHGSEWDSNIPKKEYFDELKRVSKFQIIWGGNYFLDYLGATPCFLIWDKMNGTSFLADCELAWSNLPAATRMFSLHHFSKGVDKKIHPTQKPIQLYDWIFQQFAKPGMKILDTHLGSGSSAIAAHYAGLEFVGCEIGAEHYQRACERIKKQTVSTPKPQIDVSKRNRKINIRINRRAGKLVFLEEGKAIPQHIGIKLAQKSLGLSRKELSESLNLKSRSLDTYYLESGNVIPERLMLKIMRLFR